MEEKLIAPEFVLLSARGKEINLSDYKGKKVILFFYPQDNKPKDIKEVCGFRNAYSFFIKHRISVIGISKDSQESHKTFTKKYNLPYLLLCDPKNKIAKTYDKLGKRTKGIGKWFGEKRSTFFINENGEIIKIWKNVDASKHLEEVKEEILKNT